MYYLLNSLNSPLSNWTLSKFIFDNLEFTSAEQCFQYNKAKTFENEEIANEILQHSDPAICYQLGREIKNYSETKWDKLRMLIMIKILRQKFLQNTPLKKELLLTEHKPILNAMGRNKIWAIGIKHPQLWGKNLLGILLTKLRDDIYYYDQKRTLKHSNRLASNYQTSQKALQRFDSHNDWNSFVGNKFYHIFTKIQLDQFGTIIEIGPGSVSKVGQGLRQYGFKGTIYVVEPELNSLIAIEKSYTNLLPECKIVSINSTLKEFIQQIHYDQAFDLLIGNHVIDDILIGEYICKNDFKFFENHYEDADIRITAKYWESLCKDITARIKISKEIINELITIAIKCKFVISSLYDSYIFRLNEYRYPAIHHAHIFSRKIQNNFKTELLSNNFEIINLEIKDVIQHPDYWLCAKNNR